MRTMGIYIILAISWFGNSLSMGNNNHSSIDSSDSSSSIELDTDSDEGNKYQALLDAIKRNKDPKRSEIISQSTQKIRTSKNFVPPTLKLSDSSEGEAETLAVLTKTRLLLGTNKDQDKANDHAHEIKNQTRKRVESFSSSSSEDSSDEEAYSEKIKETAKRMRPKKSRKVNISFQKKRKKKDKEENDIHQFKANDSMIYHLSALARNENFWWLIGSLGLLIGGFYRYLTYVDEDDSSNER